MKWYTCIIHVQRHVTPVQWFHTRAETPSQAKAKAAAWIKDEAAGIFVEPDDVDVPLVFEGRLEPVGGDEVD